MATRHSTLATLAFLLIVSLALPVGAAPAAPRPPADITIRLLDRLPSRLAEGESYTVAISVESDTPFDQAISQATVYYPAYVGDNGGDSASQTNSAVLHVTLTGRRSTSELPGGATAVSLLVGVRRNGELVGYESFDFELAVR